MIRPALRARPKLSGEPLRAENACRNKWDGSESPSLCSTTPMAAVNRIKTGLTHAPIGVVPMAKPDVNPPRGMRDLLPALKESREAVLAVIRRQFSLYGYQEIETPALEELSRLLSSDSGENEKLIFRILKRNLDENVDLANLADLGLRFDLTVPLARSTPPTGLSCRRYSAAFKSGRSGAPSARRKAASASSPNAISMSSANPAFWLRSS